MERRQPNGKTILVVDDDSILLEAYRDLLLLYGYSVIARTNAAAALVDIQNGTPLDLVVTDFQMPGMDGLGFIMAVKRIASQMPLIMLTACLNVDLYFKAIRAGAIDCVEKPTRVAEFLAVVEAALEAARPGPRMLGKRNCWDVKLCGRGPGSARVCPAANATSLNGVHGGINGGRACWTVAGTMCGGAAVGTTAAKIRTCALCDFLNAVRQEEERTVQGFLVSHADMVNANQRRKQ